MIDLELLEAASFYGDYSQILELLQQDKKFDVETPQ